MPSLRRLFAQFALLLVSSRVSVAWQQNSDVMDFAIGIHYNNVSAQLAVNNSVKLLVDLINELAAHFQLSATKTRIAIVEFGGVTPTVLLSIQQGVSVANVAEATKKIGSGEHTTPTSVSVGAVAHRTRELVFRSNANDRVEVPKLVTVITANDTVRSGNGWKCDANPKSEEAGANAAHVVFLESFYYETNKIQYAAVYALNFGSRPRVRFKCHHEHADFVSQVATKVVALVKDSLSTCVFKEVTGACYFDAAKACVADVVYELAYKNLDDQRAQAEPDKWKDVHPYCFRNGTKTCPSGVAGCKQITGITPTPPIAASTDTAAAEPEETGPTTIGSSATSSKERQFRDEDDEHYYYHDDPIVVNLRRALIGLGVAVAIGLPIDVALVFYVWKIRKEELAQQKMMKAVSESASAKASTLEQSSAGWTVITPPDVTITPSDDLMKDYAKRKG